MTLPLPAKFMNAPKTPAPAKHRQTYPLQPLRPAEEISGSTAPTVPKAVRLAIDPTDPVRGNKIWDASLPRVGVSFHALLWARRDELLGSGPDREALHASNLLFRSNPDLEDAAVARTWKERVARGEDPGLTEEEARARARVSRKVRLNLAVQKRAEVEPIVRRIRVRMDQICEEWTQALLDHELRIHHESSTSADFLPSPLLVGACEALRRRRATGSVFITETHNGPENVLFELYTPPAKRR